MNMNLTAAAPGSRSRLLGVRISLACLTIVGVCCGCSGVNASKSVSPLDFFLPAHGLLQNAPSAPALSGSTNDVVYRDAGGAAGGLSAPAAGKS
jgi:hypothetical protein